MDQFVVQGKRQLCFVNSGLRRFCAKKSDGQKWSLCVPIRVKTAYGMTAAATATVTMFKRPKRSADATARRLVQACRRRVEGENSPLRA